MLSHSSPSLGDATKPRLPTPSLSEPRIPARATASRWRARGPICAQPSSICAASESSRSSSLDSARGPSPAQPSPAQLCSSSSRSADSQAPHSRAPAPADLRTAKPRRSGKKLIILLFQWISRKCRQSQSYVSTITFFFLSQPSVRQPLRRSGSSLRQPKSTSSLAAKLYRCA